jgi:hypothetical protein
MGTSYNLNIVSDSLVLCLDAADKNSYPGTGNTWYDLCGKNNTTISGATYNSDGYFVLDGSNDYFEVTYDGRTDFAVQDFTIEIWCYVIPDGSYEVLWSYDLLTHESPYYSQHLRTVNDVDALYGSTLINQHHDETYVPNKWTQLVWTVTDTGSTKASKLYQDSVLLGSGTPNVGNITYYDQEVWVGRSNFATGYFKGSIANVKFYSRSLSSTEIQQNFNVSRTRFGL